MADTEHLVAMARAAAQKAYAPYSRFHVGAAVLSQDGRIATGANMENACYRLGLCAEQSALAAAQQDFGLSAVTHIAVAGGAFDGERLTGIEAITPCGGCRQAIAEAATRSGRDIEIICAAATGDARLIAPISQLLPSGFGAEVLPPERA